MINRPTLLAALALAVSPLAAMAQTSDSVPSAAGSAPTATSAGPVASVSSGDRHFAAIVVESNLAEIHASQIALQHAQSPDVKTFAQQMIDDHTKANDQLTKLATKDNVKVPTAENNTHAKEADKLAKLDGAKFDQAYVADMVKDHDKAVKTFAQQAGSGKDPEILAWTKMTQPTIQQHDDMAHKLQTDVKTAAK